MYEDEEKRGDMTIGSWMGALLLMAIPIVNLVPMLCWAIASKKPSKRSYAIASLIWLLIIAVTVSLSLILFHGPILAWLKSMAEVK